MNNNRWLIIIGMIVIIGMLVTAAFALGVSVGKHGWGDSELQDKPPRNAPPPAPDKQGGQNQPRGGQQSPQDMPNLPPGRPQIVGILREFNNLPPGRPQIVGILRELNDECILLAAQNGLREISIEPETRYITDTGEQLEFTDLKKGDILGVFGRFFPNNGGIFIADIVIRLPPKP
jgi:hypothetical protein